MSATFREHSTPDGIKGRYVVARLSPLGGGTVVDYLSGFGDHREPSYGGITVALGFETKSEAACVAIHCRRRDQQDFIFDAGVAA